MQTESSSNTVSVIKDLVFANITQSSLTKSYKQSLVSDYFNDNTMAPKKSPK